MASRSRMLALYILGGLSCGLAIVGARAVLVVGVASWQGASLVLLLCVFNVVFWILRIPVGRGSISVSAVVSYLSVALLGTWPSVGLKLPAILVSSLMTPHPPTRKAAILLVNTGVMSATVLMAGAAYAAMGGRIDAPLSVRSIPSYIAMSMTYSMANLMLLALVKGLIERQIVWDSLVDSLRQFWVNGVLWTLVGFLSQVMYSELNLAGLLTAFGALLAARFTFQQYANNLKTRSELAGVLTQALSYKDPYTGEHSRRVGAYAVDIGRQLGLTDLQIEKLHDAALLHDIGKVAVPDAVLVKPGPLDVAEKERMERHVGAGGELLEHSPHLRELADYVRAHHAHLDQTSQPPLIARIIAVADAFDAMTSDRPYRRALPLEEAVRRLRDASGTQFDPGVVAALLRSIGHSALHAITNAPAGTGDCPPTATTPDAARPPT